MGRATGKPGPISTEYHRQNSTIDKRIISGWSPNLSRIQSDWSRNGRLSRFSGSIVATAFTGDGSGLTNLANDSLFKSVPSGIGTGISPIGAVNVGIGTTRPLDDVNLTVGAVGSSGTSMHVFSEAKFAGIVTTNNLTVAGVTTIVGEYEINNVSSGIIRGTSIGIGTTNPLTPIQVGTANSLGVPDNGHVFSVTGIGSVGIGTTVPKSHLHVEGHTKFKTHSESVTSPSISSNEITLDLSTAQSFTITASDDINAFVVTNPPSGSSSFTLKILQDSTGGRSVGIDTFKNNSGTSIPVYWPGGVVPIVTTTADKTDIYSFKTFDGDNLTTSGLYGVVGGQNFS